MPELTIATRPSVSPLTLLRLPHALPPPLDRGRVTLYTKARTAIWHVLTSLGVGPGDSVLVPSYNCGADFDPVLKTPAVPRFYRINRHGDVDVEDLERAIDETSRAVLITHYFGFPQPELSAIVELCTARNVPLIEDCAHALLSSHGHRPLGTFGAAGVFSLWKTLPLPDGAAVRADGLTLDRPARAPLYPALRSVRSSLGAGLASRHARVGTAVDRYVLRPAGALAKRAARRPPEPRRASGGPDPRVTFDPATSDRSISAPALALARRADHETIRCRRRRNYRLLAAALEPVRGLRLLHSELPDGVTPLWLPAIVDDAPGLHAELGRAGIGSEVFWSLFHPAFPAERFPDATFLKQHVVALPTHQDLERASVERIAGAVRSWAAATQ